MFLAAKKNLILFTAIAGVAFILSDRDFLVFIGNGTVENVLRGKGQQGEHHLALTTLQEWNGAIENHRKALAQKIGLDYGTENAEAIFFKSSSSESRGRDLLISPYDPHWEVPQGEEDSPPIPSHMEGKSSNFGLVRRMALKLLQASLSDGQQDQKFVFVTAGMSSAAGHGNLMSESYTHVIQESLGPIFEELGLRLEARNYGMSAMSSGGELAFCSREVYGDDVDILNWDFGITDGRKIHKMAYFMWRSARQMQPLPPVFTAVSIGPTMNHSSSVAGRRIEAGRVLSSMGLDVLLENDKVLKDAASGIPDTGEISDEEVDSLPPMVKYFKCNGKLESGEPCSDFHIRFSSEKCPNRRYRVGWHPGFRIHAFYGNMRSLSLLDALQDAVAWIRSEMEKDLSQSTEKLIQQTIEEQEAALALFQSASVPQGWVDEWKELRELSDSEEFQPEWLWNFPSWCQTAREPSQLRVKGLIEPQIKLELAKTSKNESTLMRTIFDAAHFHGDQLLEGGCTVPVEFDYRDYYYAGSHEDWRELFLPLSHEGNRSTLQGSGSRDDLLGIVAVCLTKDHIDKSEAGIQPNEFGNSTAGGELLANGEKVSGATKISDDCFLLKHDTGYRFPVKDNRIRLQVRSVSPERYIRFTSFAAF